MKYNTQNAKIESITEKTLIVGIDVGSETREKDSLKKMQSVIAVACKALRIFYAILTKGVTYDGAKMLQDIKRPQLLAA